MLQVLDSKVPFGQSFNNAGGEIKKKEVLVMERSSGSYPCIQGQITHFRALTMDSSP